MTFIDTSFTQQFTVLLFFGVVSLMYISRLIFIALEMCNC